MQSETSSASQVEKQPQHTTPESAVTTPTAVAAVAAPPSPPPDGGWQAWSQVVGGFFFVFNTWGLANAFGVFQTYYTTTLIPSSTPSEISWIGSIQGFLLLFVGVGCGRALDAGIFYPVAFFGIFLEVFGMMMTSLCTKYYQLFLAQGLCIGIGSGCLFTPSISIVGTYFGKKRSLAIGLAAAGSSIGGIIYPIVIRRLILDVGFPWAVRTMAFIMLATLLVGVALLRPRMPPRKSGPLIDTAALRDPAYTLFIFGLMLGFMAFFIPFFYAESYALNIGTDADLAFYVLSIMNAAGAIGRLLPNAVADKIGNLNIIVPSALLSGVVALAWMRAHTTAGLIVVSFMYALVSGPLMALPPAIVVTLCPDLSKIGVRVGMMMTVGSIGVLFGSPIAGAILTRSSRGIVVPAGQPSDSLVGRLDFDGVLIFTGVVVLVCGALMAGTRFVKNGIRFEKI